MTTTKKKPPSERAVNRLAAEIKAEGVTSPALSNGTNPPEAGPLACPECRAAGIDRSFDRVNGLSRHRFQTHGVVSANAALQQARAKRKARKQAKKMPEAGKTQWLRAGGLYVCSECKAEGIHQAFTAATALGLHRRQVHGIVGTSKTSVNVRKANAATPGEAAAAPVKRPYTRPPKAEAPAASVRFCPSCGCDMHAVSMALHLAGTMRR